MKTRSGFVSNSSSSSFIVALPRKPKDAEELQSFIFKDTENFYHPYEMMHYSAEEVSETVFGDISNSPETIQSSQSMAKVIECGYIEEVEFDSFKKEDGRLDWDAYRLATTKVANEKAERFIKENKDSFFFSVSYGDDDTYGSALEHGDLFRNVPHIRISCH